MKGDGYGYLSRPDGAPPSTRKQNPRPPLSAQNVRGVGAGGSSGARPVGLPQDGAPRITAPPRLEPRRVQATTREGMVLFAGIDDPDIPPIPWAPSGDAYGATFTPSVTTDPDAGGDGATLIESAIDEQHGWRTPDAADASSDPAVFVEISGYVKAAGRNYVTIANGTVSDLSASLVIASAVINLTTGAVTDDAVAVIGSDLSYTEPTPLAVTDAGNGWWHYIWRLRVEYIGGAFAGLSIDQGIVALMNGSDPVTNLEYLGDGTSGVELYRTERTVAAAP